MRRWGRGAGLAGLLLVGVMAVALISSAAPALAAQGDIDFVGGPTYNTYSLDWGGFPKFFDDGAGFRGELRYWLEDDAALGAAVDYFTGTGGETFPFHTTTVDMDVLGYLVMLNTVWSGERGLGVEPYAAVGSYGGVLEVNIGPLLTSDGSIAGAGIMVGEGGRTTLTLDREIGYLVGVRLANAHRSGLSFHVTGGYRWLKVDSGTTEDGAEIRNLDADLSGLSVGAGITAHF